MVSYCNNFLRLDQHLSSQLEAPVEVLATFRREDVKVLLKVAFLVELAAKEGVLEEESVSCLVLGGSLVLAQL